MCTLVAVVRHFPGLPLVVAANRDELLDRPSSALRVWHDEPAFIAPKDEKAGGTWLGVNTEGLFVGVTNRFGAPREESRASRGKLVLQALKHPSAESVHFELATLPADAFNPFHLFYADRERAFVTWSDGAKVTQQDLAPGLHVVTERSLGGDDKARTERVQDLWKEIEALPLPKPDKMMDLMRQHGNDDPVGGTCVHVPALNYGTRSSCILLLGPSWQETRLFWAEGSPCIAKFAERDDLLRLLAGASPDSFTRSTTNS